MKTKNIIIGVSSILILSVLMTVGLFVIKVQKLEKGITAIEEGRYSDAIEHIRTLSKLGDSNAQYLYGLLYANGWGVVKDRDEAIKWFRKAAMRHYGDYDEAAPAAFQLGRQLMQEKGDGFVWSDDPEDGSQDDAVFWLKWSADHGYSQAAELIERLSGKAVINSR